MSSPLNTRSGQNPLRTDRGSALITVLLMAAVVAILAAHLLTRATQEQKLATRSYYQSVALNLAEAGIEEAMWALNNNYAGTAHGWSTTGDGTGARRRSTTTGLSLAQGSGEIHLRIDQPATNTPTVTALGIVRLPNQPPVMKQLHVKLLRRSIWANAIVAKGSVTFNGTRVSIDAYDSLVGPWHSTSNRLDRATVATNLATNGGLAVNNADIFGSVATGGGKPLVGPTGSILGATSPSGLPDNTDPANVRKDFAYNIPDAVLPTSTPITLGVINNTITLPRAGDTPDANGRYVYSSTGININNKILTIDGKVDLIVTGDVDVGGGSGAIVINSGANRNLNLYAAGDISISGSGAMNLTSSPPNMTIYGTRTQAQVATLGYQEFSLSGNASYSGLVYAPNAEITLRGGGSSGRFDGAIIGQTVTFSGNYEFHYDVQLGGIQSDRYFRPSDWLELTAPAASGAGLARDNREPFNAVL
jgi:hypothetical protein